jgi:hypothetical protein
VLVDAVVARFSDELVSVDMSCQGHVEWEFLCKYRKNKTMSRTKNARTGMD